MQDDYFDKLQNIENMMTCLELIEHKILRKLLLKCVLNGRHEFMYANHDMELVKDDWVEIVE